MNTSVHTTYKTKDGVRVPSVTTYLGILAKPALIHWSWTLGVQGLDYRKVKDEAGDIGTLVHYLILCQLKSEEPDLSDYTPQVVDAASIPMEKFEEWYKEHELEPRLLETPLVSEYHRFGGTPDFYGMMDGKLTLLDFKTSNAIYSENFHQLAAYERLLEEAGHSVETVAILRLGKSEDEGFEYRASGNLDNHWKMFLACKQVYELQKEIRRTKKAVE